MGRGITASGAVNRSPGNGPHPALSRSRERVKRHLLASLIDRPLWVGAPFGVRSRVELDLLVAERAEGEVRVGGADAGAAVRDDGMTRGDALGLCTWRGDPPAISMYRRCLAWRCRGRGY